MLDADDADIVEGSGSSVLTVSEKKTEQRARSVSRSINLYI